MKISAIPIFGTQQTFKMFSIMHLVSLKMQKILEYSLEGLMLKLKLQNFGHLKWRTDSLEKTLMLGKIEGRRRREQ